MRRPRRGAPQFYAEQVPGETPLGKATAIRLVGVAMRLYAVLDEWEQYLDSFVVLGSAEEQRFVWANSVAYPSIAVLRRRRGYLAFLAAMERETPTNLARQDNLFVQYRPLEELDGLDRHLLVRGVGLSLDDGDWAPRFRVCRPGFQEWYLNEAEGVELADVLEKLERFLHLTRGTNAGLWRPDTQHCPWATFDVHGQMHVQQLPFAGAAEPGPAFVPGEEALLELESLGLRQEGWWELDHLCIDEGTELDGGRPAYWRMAMAVNDAEGMLGDATFRMAHYPVGQILWEAFVKAARATGRLPRRLRFREPEAEATFAPVSLRLGVTLWLAEPLRHFDALRPDEG